MKTIHIICILISVFLTLITNIIQAQESIHAAGGNASSSSGSVSYSIGQVNYSYQSTTAGKISQGVQQPYEIFSVGINEYSKDLQISLYPNPTIHELILSFKDFSNEAFSFELYDIEGKILLSNKITEENTTIDMISFAAATYFINIKNKEGKNSQIFKVIKN